jgi:hypothetical protein
VKLPDERQRMSPDEKRARNRLASLRWRRAHGIGPRKPAQRPWLAEGISRSKTWYRRRAKARQEAVLEATFTRADVFIMDSQRELAEAQRCHAIAAGIIRELAAISCARSPVPIGPQLCGVVHRTI